MLPTCIIRTAGFRWRRCGTPCFNGAAPARARRENLNFTLQQSKPGFNGAAPARARRGLPSGGRSSGEESFNGAAPARARRDQNLARPQNRNPQLQRGRARAGAERRAMEPCAQKQVVPASTGPRPRGRGEVRQPMRKALDYLGFNGAAPARARRVLFCYVF